MHAFSLFGAEGDVKSPLERAAVTAAMFQTAPPQDQGNSSGVRPAKSITSRP